MMRVFLPALLLCALTSLPVAGQPAPPTGNFSLTNGWLRHPERPLTLTYADQKCVLDGILYRGDYDRAAEEAGARGSRTRLLRLDSFIIKQTVQDYKHVSVSDTRVADKGLDAFPKVNFYVPEADAEAFVIYHREKALHAVKFDRVRLLWNDGHLTSLRCGL
ncbi:MAG TPA: hypothetical protein PK095_15390, partial [Myxococcota bacterium]|nr:hypothetical protein [Myxococcota bacterium]